MKTLAVLSDKGGSLTARALWIACAKTLAFVLGFILPMLLVRRLDQREFGLYKQVFLVVGTAVAMLPLGFAMSAFYFLPREPARRNQVVLNILLFNTTVGVFACLALWLRPSLLSSIFHSAELEQYAPLVGVVVLFWIISSFLEFIAVANQEARLATLFIIAAQLTKTTLMVAAALLAPTVEALIYAALFQGILQTVVLLFYLARRFPGFWRAFEWETLRAQLAYALPLGLAGVLYTAQMDLHNYVVSYRFDAATFALYAVGCFQFPLVGILNESVGSVMIPRVSELQHEGRHHEIVALTARAMRKLAAAFFPLYVLLLVVAREFITVLYTELYLGSVPIFTVFLTLIPFSIFVLDPVMRAYAEHRYFLLKVRPALIVMLFAGLWYGTQRFGLTGAVAAMVGVTVLERLITAFKVARIARMTRRDLVLFKDIGKLAAAAAVAGICTALLRALVGGAPPFAVLVMCGGFFVPAYLAAAYLLGVPTAEEKRLVHSRLGDLQRRLPWRRAAGNPA